MAIEKALQEAGLGRSYRLVPWRLSLRPGVEASS